MTKLKRILACFLVLSQVGSISSFAVETQQTELQTSSYTVSIPESVTFGTLSHEEENHVTYQVSATYTGTDYPALRVTSDTTGTLYYEESSLTFSNSLSTATLTSEEPTATGTLSIDQNQVVAATDGTYAGTLQFAIAQTSATLSLSASRLYVLQGEVHAVTATLIGGDGYTLSVQSSDEAVATVNLADNVLTMTAVNSQSIQDATATITVSAEKAGADTLIKTVVVTVYGCESTAVDVTTTVVEGSANVTITGDAILTNSGDSVDVSDNQVVVNATTDSDSVSSVQVAFDQATMETIADHASIFVLETDTATFSLNSDALEQIAQEMVSSTSSSPIVLNIATKDPEEAQSDYDFELDNSIITVYELTLTVDDQPIPFDNGSITISVPCAEDIQWVYYIVDGVLMEQVPVTVVDGIGSFTVTHFSLWGLSSEDYFSTEDDDDDDSSSTTPGITPNPDTGYFLSDGNYYVDLWLWHQYADQASMGDVAFENNRQALVTVSNGKVTRVEVATGPVNVSGIESAVQYLEVEGEDIGYLERALVTTNTNYLTFYYIVRAEFTMPTKGQPTSTSDATYLDVRLAVPDTPMDMVVDEDGCMSARFKFDWSTVEATTDGNVAQDDTTSNSTLTDSTTSTTTVEDSVAASEVVYLTPSVDSDGNAKVTISEDDLEDALEAILEALEDETDEAATSLLNLVVSFDDEDEATSLTTIIREEAFQMLVEQVDYVKLITPMASVLLDSDSLQSIATQSEDDVEINLGYQDISSMSLLNETLIDLVGQRPVVSISISSNDLVLEEIDGIMTVSIPYTPDSEEDTIKLTVYYITAEGESAEISNAYYSLGYLVFTTNTLYDTYAVTYDEHRQLYLDVPATAWYYDAVIYVTEQNLFTGTGFQIFSPEENMSRAMLITVLYRLAEEPEVSGTLNYSDVLADQWYTNAALWSVQNRIVEGYGDGTFGTDDGITREQIATILYRYAAKTGALVTGDLSILDNYSDSDSISSWAVHAMAWAVNQGLITGMTETTLAPQGTATRAQVATIFMRYTQ